MKKFLAALAFLFVPAAAMAQGNPYSVTAPQIPAASMKGAFPSIAQVNLTWFAGVDATGSTDSYAGIVLALSYMSSHPGKLYIPYGTYSIASATASPLVLSSNLDIQCDPGTIIQVTGSAVLSPLAGGTNINHFRSSGCTWKGNSQAINSCSSCTGGFLFTNTSSNAMTDIVFTDTVFTNFKQNYWVYFFNNASAVMSNIRLTNVTCTTLTGNMGSNQATDINYPANCITFRGQAANLSGVISDVVVDGLNADITWAKTAVAFYEGVTAATVVNTVSTGCGTHTATNTGGYCYLAYQTDLSKDEPNYITWSNTKALTPYSVGFYTAGARNLLATGLYVEGQSDTGNASLPKGGIALNQCEDCHVVDFVGLNNFVCVDTSGAPGKTTDIEAPICTSNVANAVGIRVVPNGVSDATVITRIHNPVITLTDATSVGVLFSSNTGASQNPGSLEISGGKISAGAIDVQTNDTGTSNGVTAQWLRLGDGLTLYGPATTGGFVSVSNATPTQIDGLIVDAVSFAAGAVGVNLTSATKADISGLLLKNKTSGAGTMLDVENTTGSMPPGAVVYRNVGASQKYTTTTFGFATPGFTAVQGTTVQNLNPSEAGSALSKYIVNGWMNTDGGTTWLPLRTLTGN